jgi:hypothetical protein
MAKAKKARKPEEKPQQNPSGLITVDKKLNVLSADRFFLDGVGGTTSDPEGKPLAEVLGESVHDDDSLEAMANRENKNGAIQTERRAPGGGKRTLKVEYSRTKLENDESAIFMTVEALPEEKLPAKPAKTPKPRGKK